MPAAAPSRTELAAEKAELLAGRTELAAEKAEKGVERCQFQFPTGG